MNKRRKIIRAMASAAGGGVKRPANPNDILQWLTAYDGVTPFVDKKDVVASPAVTGVNVGLFNGTTTLLDASPCPIIDYPFTICAYVKTTQAVDIRNVATVTNSLNQHRHSLRLDQVGRFIALSAKDNASAQARSTVQGYNDGEWHYAEARFASATDRSIWVGTGPDDVVEEATNSTSKEFVASITEFAIGNRGITTQTAFFDGELSGVGIKVDGEYVSRIPMAEGTGAPADIARGIDVAPTDFAYTSTNSIGPYSINLAEGFTPEYVHSDATLGDERIDLGEPLADNFKIRVSIEAYGAGNTYFLGGGAIGEHTRLGINSGGFVQLAYKGASGTTDVVTALTIGRIYEFECAEGIFYQDGFQIKDLTAGATTTATNGYLFSWNNPSGSDSPANCKIYDFEQSTRNMVPSSNGTMTDTLTGTRYANGGSGVLVTRMEALTQPQELLGIAIIGQSNAEGLVEGVDLLTADMLNGVGTGYLSNSSKYVDAGVDDTYVYQSDLKYVDPNGVNPNVPSTTWGVEVPLGIKMENAGLGPFAWYKSAIGGTSIRNLQATGTWWSLTEAAYNNHQTAWGNRPVVQWVVFMQGESECGQSASGARYAQDQKLLIQDWKNLYNNQDLKVILVGTPKYYYDLDAVYSHRIEQSKIDLANEDPNVFYVQMYDLPITVGGGDGHYDQYQMINDVSERIYPIIQANTTANPRNNTNLPSYVHNGAECSIKQTDADETIFGGATLWGNGTDTWDEVSYADLLDEPSNTTNGWYKWVSIDGVCHLKECFQYDVTDTLTEAEYNKNAQYVGAGGGCGSIAPFL